MKKIFVIGKIGAGKSCVSVSFYNTLIKKGYKVALIDLDIYGKELLNDEAIQLELKNAFYDFSDNKELATIAFSNEKNADKLNAIMHPLIYDKLVENLHMFQSSDYDYVVVEQSVFCGPSDKFIALADAIVFVDCDKDIRLQRCLDKGMSEEDFKARDGLQCDEADMLSSCNLYVKNSFSKNKLKEQVQQLVNNL